MNELRSHLRQNGVESEREVRLACMESDGNLSILKYERATDADLRERKRAKSGAAK